MAYAATTDVTIAKTKTEIEALITKRKATGFGIYTEGDTAIVIFRMHDRQIRFTLPVPELGAKGSDQARRSRWRALLLVIKAKLESVESGIETFEESFLAHVVMADGRTVYERTQKPIAEEYRLGVSTKLLLSGPIQ